MNWKRLLLWAAVLPGLTGCVRFEDRPLSAAAVADKLESRSLAEPGARQFLETHLHSPLPVWPPSRLSLEELTLVACYFHPSLDVARAQWAVARGGETTAGARPNPVLGVTPGYSANAPGGVSPWFPSVTLDVPIETAGKRGHRLDQSRNLAEAARWNLATVAWQVRSGVRAALVEYVAAQSRARAFQDQLVAGRELLQVMEQRVAAGAAAQLEAGPLRLNALKLSGEAAEAERLAGAARVRVAEAVGLPLRALAGVELHFEPEGENAGADLAQRRRAALLGRADVQAALAEYAATQAALRLEVAKQYPDLHFNPGYQYDQGENKWQLGLSVELPVLYRNQGGIAEALARREESAARFTALQARIIAELDRAEVARQLAEAQARQVETLSQAHQSHLRQLESSLRAGAADRLEVVTAQLELAALEQLRAEAWLKRQQADGLMEDALQRPLAALPSVEQDPKVSKHP